MRTGAARGQVSHFHEAGFYGSDADFRTLIVPFAEEGIAAGEPEVTFNRRDKARCIFAGAPIDTLEISQRLYGSTL